MINSTAQHLSLKTIAGTQNFSWHDQVSMKLKFFNITIKIKYKLFHKYQNKGVVFGSLWW